MQNKYIAPEMLQPTSLLQLSQMMIQRPRALLMGGGIHLLSHQDSELFALPPEIILLNQVSELNRLTRNDHFFEIGSSVTLQRLLDKAYDYLPEILLKTLYSIGNMAIRNQATIGGTLAITSYRSDLFVVLALLDAKIEIKDFSQNKGKGKNRRLPLLRLVKEGFLDLASSEVIISIRLPIVEWTHWHREKLHRPFTTDKQTLLILLVTRIEKEVIHGFHVMILAYGTQLIYDYTLDAQLVGRHYPIASKELPFLTTLIEEGLEREEYFLSDYIRYTIRSVMLHFLQGKVNR